MKRIYLALIFIGLCLCAPVYGQDDLYGDEYQKPSKQQKQKTQIPKGQQQKSTTSPSTGNTNTPPASTTPPASGSTNAATIYLMRPVQGYSGNSGLFTIKFNGVTIAELKAGTRISYKIYSEGTLKVFCQYKVGPTTEFYKTFILEVKNSESYYILLHNLFDQTKVLDKEYGPRTWNDAGLYKYPAAEYYENKSMPLTVKSTSTPTAPVASNICNGMLINNRGYILLSASSIDKAKKISVRLIQGNTVLSVPANVVFEDKSNNIALIKIEDSLVRNIAVPDIKMISPAKGDTLICLYKEVGENASINQIKVEQTIIVSEPLQTSSPAFFNMQLSIPANAPGGIILDGKGRWAGIWVPTKDVKNQPSAAVRSLYANMLVSVAGGQSIPENSNSIPLDINTAASLLYLIEITR